jgi:GNAT superfamily N-acetyltransferase
VGVQDGPVNDLTAPDPSATSLVTSLLARIERSYDAIPRVEGVRVEAVGPFQLFVREGAGWPFYARPRLGVVEVAPADVEAVLVRQRELGVPEAIEWVIDTTPALLPLVQRLMPVTLAPLMVLDPGALPDPTALPESAPGCRLLDPDSPTFADDCAVSFAVARVGFGFPGTSPGSPGPSHRDAATDAVQPEAVAASARDLRAGRKAEAVYADPESGIVARGAFQSALGAAEIVGVATLPSARHRGYGAAVSALLARQALARGNDIVFLSAASDDVARVYARIGFRRIGTAGIAEAAAPHA